ncbi:MAG: hypothetical protein IH629_03910 [Thermoleophilia bacterium]|nr:hypothetical protein [Thermoleophilia bacterium]
MQRALRSFARRALLSFGPVAAIAVGFVVVGSYATGTSQPEPLPDLGLLRGMTPLLTSRVDNVPVFGTAGDDTIEITGSSRGTVRVTVNGRRRELTVGSGRTLVVSARGGDDTVRVRGSARATLVLRGGAGDDLLVGGTGDDILDGGRGDDVLEGRAGNDLVDAGEGNDVVRLGPGQDGADGGDGRDLIAGDGGDDYLQGGRGEDTLQGDDGRDVVYGLDGRDRLSGGGGSDYLDGGGGDDDVAGQGGRDIAFGGTGNDILRDLTGGDLLVGGEGQDAFVADELSRIVPPAGDEWSRAPDVIELTDDRHGFAMRAGSDLEALRSLPLGRELLAGLAASGHTVVLRATDDGNAVSWDPTAADSAGVDGRISPGTDSVVLYNPYRTVVGEGQRNWERRPPIVGLFHELVHALAVARGTMPSENAPQQAQAVGLIPDRETGPHFERAARTDIVAPATPTENSLRAFLDLPLRPPE